MTIKYLNHTITESKNIKTGKTIYQLNYWFINDDYPDVVAGRSAGFYDSYKEAEDAHNRALTDGLIKDDTKFWLALTYINNIPENNK